MTTQYNPSPNRSAGAAHATPIDMSRWLLAVILTLVLVGVGWALGNGNGDSDGDAEAIAAATSSTTQATVPDTAADSTTSSSSGTSTSAAAATVSTSASPSTAATTTQPPTTTKATTTSPPKVEASGLPIPATKAYSAALDQFGGYLIIASNADTGVFWWSAPYLGSNLPYTAGAQWISGDRQAYACAYGFIEDPNGNIAGRFTFVRPPEAGYAKVNDKFMEEAERFYDGTIVDPPQGNEITSEDCSGAALSPIDYDDACVGAVDERPRVAFFDSKGQVLDIRDYTNTSAGSVIFRLFSFTSSRATVIACENNLVGMVVYYDKLGTGQIAVDFKGTGPYK